MTDLDKLRTLVDALGGEVARLTIANISQQIEHVCTQQELEAANQRIVNYNIALSDQAEKFEKLQAECDQWRTKASGVVYRTAGTKKAAKA